MDYKGILFDFDYTLGDATEAIHQAFVYALTTMGYPAPDRESVRHTIGMVVSDAYTLLTGDATTEGQEKLLPLSPRKRHSPGPGTGRAVPRHGRAAVGTEGGRAFHRSHQHQKRHRSPGRGRGQGTERPAGRPGGRRHGAKPQARSRGATVGHGQAGTEAGGRALLRGHHHRRRDRPKRWDGLLRCPQRHYPSRGVQRIPQRSHLPRPLGPQVLAGSIKQGRRLSRGVPAFILCS